MVTADAMGIIFPNVYDNYVPELTIDRLMASVPFGSRYRMIDFILSSMVNCGIDNVSVLVRKNYHSLIDHLGSGREWDLTRKNGGLAIFPPYAQKTMGMLNGRIEGLASIVGHLKAQKEKYVVMSDANIAINFDFKKLIKTHIESGADITMVYAKEEIPHSERRAEDPSKGLYYTFDIEDDNRVSKIHINSLQKGIVNYGMNIYVIERELLIKFVKEASVSGGTYFERDIINPKLKDIKVLGYEYTDYYARIVNMKSYFDENMRLLEDDNLDALFGTNPIYTKIRDDNPTRYIGDAKASNVMVADGCIIEGEVENSILFRGVKIGKGAKVKDCILMQDTVVEAGASLEYLIADKRVHITEGRNMKGESTHPVFIAKDLEV